ncbi:MAG: hypothetical protein JXK94_02730 [Deltaproteobacteria bacterium]|nr:hypothetical protein [Deltaproteobacteria bacterium]
MNAFEAQKQVDTGIVQLTKPGGEIFRFIIFNSRVQALTLNDLPLEDGDERGPSHEDLSNNRWEIYHACKLHTKQGAPLWFTGFRML